MSYTIISGTNREGSNTAKIARQYQALLKTKGIDATLVTLEGVDLNKKNPSLEKIEKDVLIPSEKFIFVLPEYNGSFPGSLKMMIDLSDYKKVWWGKKALLTGVSTGRAGNARGMDHLSGSLNYLKMAVHPNRLPISSVDKLLNGTETISDAAIVEKISAQLDEFIAF